jgi:hypothetical protein
MLHILSDVYEQLMVREEGTGAGLRYFPWIQWRNYEKSQHSHLPAQLGTSKMKVICITTMLISMMWFDK